MVHFSLLSLCTRSVFAKSSVIISTYSTILVSDQVNYATETYFPLGLSLWIFPNSWYLFRDEGTEGILHSPFLKENIFLCT